MRDELTVAIGILTAPRPETTIDTTIADLRRAGFSQTINVFAEPGGQMKTHAGTLVTTHRQVLGLWNNWRTAAACLLDQTDADFILICEDDLRAAPCAALALQYALQTLPWDDWGYASLYAPWHNVRHVTRFDGWMAIDFVEAAWGALALCYSRRSLEELLSSDAVLKHTGDLVDIVVSEELQKSGRKCYYHIPSLVAHAGPGISSLSHRPVLGSLAVGFDYEYRGYVEATDTRHEIGGGHDD